MGQFSLGQLAVTILNGNVGPDLGDRWGRGVKIGAVLSWGRERPRLLHGSVLTKTALYSRFCEHWRHTEPSATRAEEGYVGFKLAARAPTLQCRCIRDRRGEPPAVPNRLVAA